MRYTLIFLALLSGCSDGANHLGNPFTAPISGLSTLAANTLYSQKRGQVEVLVKSNHPALIDQINAGQGPILEDAFKTSGIPVQDRPARLIQLQSDLGLYDANPGALVTALMIYGG